MVMKLALKPDGFHHDVSNGLVADVHSIRCGFLVDLFGKCDKKLDHFGDVH